MKRIFIAILAVLSLCTAVFAVTEFVCTITPAGQGGDYNTLNAWNSAVTCTLPDNMARKYPVSSAGITGSFSANNTVYGYTSKSSGVFHSVGYEIDGSSYVILHNYNLDFSSGEIVHRALATQYMTIMSSGEVLLTRVFSHSGAAGIADGSIVWGATSKSTGVVVHATANQVLIAYIRGTFQNGEQVYKSGGSLVLTSAGDSAIAVAKIDGNWSSADTTAVALWRYYETSSQNYVKIYTESAARHNGVWNTNKYRLSAVASYGGAINIWTPCVWIDGLQMENTMSPIGISSVYGIRNSAYGSSVFGAMNDVKVSNNIIRYGGTDQAGLMSKPGNQGIDPTSSGTFKAWNNIVYNWGTGITQTYLTYPTSFYVYNNTFINCDQSTTTWRAAIYFSGSYQGNPLLYHGFVYLKNNLVIGTTGCYYGGSNYLAIYQTANNLSSDGTSPNAAYRNLSPSFRDAATNYYLLSSTDAAAVNAGADLTSDPHGGISFNTDILDTTRPVFSAWDIGAHEMVPSDVIAPDAVTDLASSAGSTSGQVDLTWTCTGDDGTTNNISGGSFIIEKSTSPSITWNAANPSNITISTSVTARTRQEWAVGGLTTKTSYYFHIWTRDEIPWTSAISNRTTCYVPDITAPADIKTSNGLSFTATSIGGTGSIVLAWLSPGNDNLSGTLTTGCSYYIQYATYTGVTWSYTSAQVIIATAGPVAFAPQVWMVPGLAQDATYYFRLWTADESQNYSSISDGATAYVVDYTAPGSITDLSAATSAEANAITLAWTTPSDDAGTLRPLDTGSIYRIQYASYSTVNWSTSVDEARVDTISTNTVVVGSTATWKATTLVGGATYYFRIWSKDDNNQWSSISNGATNYALRSVVPPNQPAAVRDGTGASDADIFYSTYTLTANWDVVVDTNSGLAKYWYAVSSWTAGDTGFTSGWVDNSLSTTVTRVQNLVLNTTYYFAVRAESIDGQQSTVKNSNGSVLLADPTPPALPDAVRDGTGSIDISSTTSLTQLSANWDAAADAESGISKYWYGISALTAGATDYLGWTDAGNALSVTVSTPLAYGATYYFVVKAENGIGVLSSTRTSNGVYVIDITAPGAPSVVRDGTGTDVAITTSSTQLYANWDAAVDTESGITSYQYAIGTTAGGTQTANWTSVGTSTYANRPGLVLTWATTYYFTVKATNGANLTGTASNSTGQRVIDVTSPTAPGTVNDGNGADTNVTYSTYSLSANWTSSADADSGISSYSYAISTTAGGTNLVGWTSVGASTWVTRGSLTLTGGTTYYFTVRAYNYQGLVSTYTANSNGQYVNGDSTPPSAPAAVNDGTGTDESVTYSTYSLSANWTAATDNESGIGSYEYAVGTTTSTPSLVAWTNVGNVLTITNSSLTLAADTTYYIIVKAINGGGLTGSPRSSNGIVALNDGTAPGWGAAAVRDGTGADISTTSALTSLSANWDAATDAESAVVKYWYSIGTTPGGTEVLVLTDAGNVLTVTYNTTLAIGTTYYFSVIAENGAGLQSAALNSSGVRAIDATGPSAPAAVRDGTGSADVSVTTTTTQLSANWDASADAESGIAKYWFAVSSTVAGGTNFVAWTDNGTSTRTTITVTLVIGTTYYITVKAQNGSGLQGNPANSNGIYIGQLAPPAITNVTITNNRVTGPTAEVTIAWSTDKQASSQVEYGLTASYNSSTSRDNTPVTTHAMTLTDLAQDTVYHYRVKSRDANGVEGISADYTFTAAGIPKVPAAKAYPNPYTYSENTPMNFYVNGDNSTIEIFSVSGGLLKKLEVTVPGSNTITWNGKNTDGKVVKSGVYVYMAKDAAGTRKGKFIFIR